MRLVLFDVDGTLVDSQDIIVAAQQRAFATVGLPAPTRAESLSIVGLSLHEAFQMLTAGKGPIEELVDAYRDAFTVLRADPAFEEPFFPGALEAVAHVAAQPDTLIGLATGKSRRGVARLIERARWGTLLATVQTADDNPSKPAPDMVRAALAQTGVAAQDTVLVGDTTFDMMMARAAGVSALGVSWGYHIVAALRSAGAHAIATDWTDALRAIEALAPRAPAEPSHV